LLEDDFGRTELAQRFAQEAPFDELRSLELAHEFLADMRFPTPQSTEMELR
jgi:hypothetical protein